MDEHTLKNIEKERDYRSKTFNFGGFALMAPFGHIITDPITVFKQFGSIGFIIYLAGCLLLFVLGFYMIDIGRDILYRRR